MFPRSVLLLTQRLLVFFVSMSFVGGLFKTGNHFIKTLHADMGTRFQGSTQEDSESDDEVDDPNFIAYGRRGVTVFADIATRRTIHLDHEARAIRFYRNGHRKRTSYRLSGIHSICRTAANVLMFETKRSRTLHAKTVTLANEDVMDEFVSVMMYLLDYGDIILSSFCYMVESRGGFLTVSGLHSALQLYDMNEGLTNKDLQQVLELADNSDQFDFYDYFKNLHGTPVSNHRDCLDTLMKKASEKADTNFQQTLKCIDENIPFTLDTRLINGESVLDTAFFVRWLVSITHDRDLFVSGCTEAMDSRNFLTSGAISRIVHQSSKPGFLGHVLLTDYRIIFQNIHESTTRKNSQYTRYNAPRFFDKMSVPLTTIASIVLKPEPTSLTNKIHIKIRTKDHRKLRILFLKNGTTYDMVKLFYQKIVSLCFGSRNIERSIFAYKYKQEFRDEQTWSWSDILRDYTRQGIVKNPEWRIVDNSGYVDEVICDTYPAYIVVPASFSKVDLKNCLAFRSKNRLPALTYIHKETQACLTRSSQTLSSSGSKNLQADVDLLNRFRISGLFNQLRFVLF